MAFNFSNLDVLVADADSKMRGKLAKTLKIHNIRNVFEAFDGASAFELFKQNRPHVVITEREMGARGGEWLAQSIRNSDADVREVPIILVTGKTENLSVQDVRNFGFSEMLLAPFTVDALMRLVTYVVNNKRDFIDSATYKGPDRRRIDDPSYSGPDRRAAGSSTKNSDKPVRAVRKAASMDMWPEQEQSAAMISTLFGHYITHHELVARQLKFAQTATKESIEQQENVAIEAASQMVGLRGFDAIWQEIIEMFRCGGVSEAELFKIEKIIQTMPVAIRGKFDNMSSADNDYNQLHRSLDTEGYNSAKTVAQNLEQQPNPMSGLTGSDYDAHGVGHRHQAVEGEVSVITLDPKTGRYQSPDDE